MGANTKIEWCDHTFNPWIGCTKVSPRCDNCYAENMARRFFPGCFGAKAERKRTSVKNWKLPLCWNREAERVFKAWKAFKESNPGLTDEQLQQHGFVKPRSHRVFCGSMCDVFDT